MIVISNNMTLWQAYPPMAKIHIIVTPFAKALDLRHKPQEFLASLLVISIKIYTIYFNALL